MEWVGAGAVRGNVWGHHRKHTHLSQHAHQQCLRQLRARYTAGVWLCVLMWQDYCRVLQSVAECCKVLQRVAKCCRVMQSDAECCRVLQCVCVCWCDRTLFCGTGLLQCVAECCGVLQCVAVCCIIATWSKNTHPSQHAHRLRQFCRRHTTCVGQKTCGFTLATHCCTHTSATHCNTLQHTATHCNTM